MLAQRCMGVQTTTSRALTVSGLETFEGTAFGELIADACRGAGEGRGPRPTKRAELVLPLLKRGRRALGRPFIVERRGYAAYSAANALARIAAGARLENRVRSHLHLKGTTDVTTPYDPQRS